MDTYQKHPKAKFVATVVSIIVIAGIVMLADHLKNQKADGASLLASTPATSSTTPKSTGSSAATSGTSPSTATAALANGTFSATSNYYVPSGNETIKVNLTVQNDTITDVSIQNSEYDRTSAFYQRDFTSSYKSYVVGKKLSGLRVGVIAGASDTSQGFSDALSQIASQAQA